MKKTASFITILAGIYILLPGAVLGSEEATIRQLVTLRENGTMDTTKPSSGSERVFVLGDGYLIVRDADQTLRFDETAGLLRWTDATHGTRLEAPLPVNPQSLLGEVSALRHCEQPWLRLRLTEGTAVRRTVGRNISDEVLKELCGIDHVGIGTDFGGSGENAPADLMVVGCFEVVAAAMTKNGYPAEAVGKILGGNLVRFFSGRGEAALKIEAGGQTESVRFADFRSLKGPYHGQAPPGRIPRIFAPGFVSSDKTELNSVFTPDGGEFYFSLHIRGRRYRMYFTRQEESGWATPRPVPFGSADSDVDMCLTADGRRMYFGSNRPGGGRSGGDFKIWYVDRVGDGWTEARYLEGPVNDGKRALYPTFSRAGTMYFQGIRPDSLGDRDIYRARLSDGEYREPDRLDEAVNSVRGEGDVLIAPDESWMIVSCVGRADGLGAGDLYASFRKPDDSWSTLRNMGPPVNTAANEYCPMLSPDRRYFFFTSTRTGNGDIYWVDAAIIDGLREGAYLEQKPPGLVPELFAPEIVTTGQSEGCSGWGTNPEWFLFQRWIDGKSVLFLQSRENGRWSAAERLPWAERYQVGDFTVAPDGRSLAFVSNIPIEGLGLIGEGGNIWIAERTSSGWTEPRPAGPGVNTDFHDSYPSLAASGNIYFFSRRPGGFGQSDLYVSRRRDGRYLPAENLGPILNTDAHEWDPYIAPDESYLIFNSMKLGGDDFYISWRTASGTWGDPIHLGPDINSAGSDNRPYVTADGKYFFFTSDRRGNRDIYWVDAWILEKFRPN